MKLVIYSDPHWSTYSSILRQRGKKYSKRLEILIDSINFVEQLAIARRCDEVICLGDFFDRNNLNAEEITALNEIKWCNLKHKFLVGNHEITTDDLSMNSLNVLRAFGEVIDKPKLEVTYGWYIVYLPYIDEDLRKPLTKTLSDLLQTTLTGYFTTQECKKTLIFSHNDIKGIRYGAYVSETGYSIEEIEDNCALYLNGHLHNGGFVNEKETILNVGNLSGQNFTEDAFNHKHNIYIFDTDTGELETLENPCAINFYKFEINELKDINILDTLSDCCAVSIKVNENLVQQVKDKIKTMKNIVAHREIVFADENKEKMSISIDELAKVNHLEKFKEFCIETIGDLDIVRQELSEVCK